jgi:predicted negative regulator of RcsB-dependent stress response
MEDWIYANFGWIVLFGIIGMLILVAVANYSLRDKNKNDKPHKFPNDHERGHGGGEGF